jgi:hypothetical protein
MLAALVTVPSYRAAAASDQSPSFAGEAFNGRFCRGLPFARYSADRQRGDPLAVVDSHPDDLESGHSGGTIVTTQPHVIKERHHVTRLIQRWLGLIQRWLGSIQSMRFAGVSIH